MQERIDSEFIWKNARWPKKNAKGEVIEVLKIGQPYLMDYNPRRGTKTVSILQPDGAQAFFTIQSVPDSFFEDAKRSRERWAAMSSTRRNAALMVPQIDIPDSVATILYSQDRDGAKQLAPNDPERDKRLREISNDIDFRKLRTSEGAV